MKSNISYSPTAISPALPHSPEVLPVESPLHLELLDNNHAPEKVWTLGNSWKDAQTFSHILRTSGRWLLLGDTVALIAVLVVALFSGSFHGGMANHSLRQILAFTALGGAALLWLQTKGHYRQRLPLWETVSHKLALALAGSFAAAMGGLLVQPFPALWFGLNWGVFIVLVFCIRALTRMGLDAHGKWEIPVLLVGNGPSAKTLMHALRREPGMGFRIANQVAPEALATLRGPNAWKYLLTLHSASHVFLALEMGEFEKCSTAISAMMRERVPFSLIPPWTGLPTGTLSQHHFLMHDVLLLHDTNRLHSFISRFLKRGFDIVVSALALLLVIPLFAVVALKVRKDGGPVFFHQTRLGKGGMAFQCYKFRSMRVDAEAYLETYLAENPTAAEEWRKFQKLKADIRISRIGHFIRKTSIDELPQLFNVLKGDMSLVGPRPIIPNQREFYGDDFIYYESLRPGITGPWQVSGRNRLTFPERVQLECSYAKNWSLWMDTVILLKTIPTLFEKDSVF